MEVMPSMVLVDDWLPRSLRCAAANCAVASVGMTVRLDARGDAIHGELRRVARLGMEKL